MPILDTEANICHFISNGVESFLREMVELLSVLTKEDV